MLFTKYLFIFIYFILFYFDKNQFQFELKNIYKKINLCFKRKFLNLFRKTLQFIFKKSCLHFVLKKYFKLIIKNQERKKVQFY